MFQNVEDLKKYNIICKNKNEIEECVFYLKELGFNVEYEFLSNNICIYWRERSKKFIVTAYGNEDLPSVIYDEILQRFLIERPFLIEIPLEFDFNELYNKTFKEEKKYDFVFENGKTKLLKGNKYSTFNMILAEDFSRDVKKYLVVDEKGNQLISKENLISYESIYSKQYDGNFYESVAMYRMRNHNYYIPPERRPEKAFSEDVAANILCNVFKKIGNIFNLWKDKKTHYDGKCTQEYYYYYNEDGKVCYKAYSKKMFTHFKLYFRHEFNENTKMYDFYFKAEFAIPSKTLALYGL